MPPAKTAARFKTHALRQLFRFHSQRGVRLALPIDEEPLRVLTLADWYGVRPSTRLVLDGLSSSPATMRSQNARDGGRSTRGRELIQRHRQRPRPVGSLIAGGVGNVGPLGHGQRVFQRCRHQHRSRLWPARRERPESPRRSRSRIRAEPRELPNSFPQRAFFLVARLQAERGLLRQVAAVPQSRERRQVVRGDRCQRFRWELLLGWVLFKIEQGMHKRGCRARPTFPAFPARRFPNPRQ